MRYPFVLELRVMAPASLRIERGGRPTAWLGNWRPGIANLLGRPGLPIFKLAACSKPAFEAKAASISDRTSSAAYIAAPGDETIYSLGHRRECGIGKEPQVATAAHIYIVDDDIAIRQSLAAILAAQSFAVANFASAEEFLTAVASLPAGVLIADLRMPGMTGLDLLRHLGDRAVHFPTIVVTGQGDIPLAVRAMKEGAVDFIEKPYAIEAVLRGIEAGFARLAEPGASDPPAGARAAEAKGRLTLLTGREREVLEGLVTGLPNKSIAYDLSISPRTVEVHRARIMLKLGARSLSEIVRLGLAAGIVPRPR